MGHRHRWERSAFIALLALLPLFLAAQTNALPQGDDLVQRFETADSHFSKAEDLFLKQDFDAARAELVQCLELMPEHSEAHFLLAQIDLRQGLLNRALGHVVKAETYYDFTAKIRARQQHQYLLGLERLKDEQDTILADLEKDLSHATAPAVRQTLEDRMEQARRIRDSIENRISNPQTGTGTGPGDYHLLHAIVLAALRRYPDAEREFRTTIQIEPTSSEAYTRLAGILLLSGQARRAMDVIDEAESKGVTIDEKLKGDVLKALEK